MGRSVSTPRGTAAVAYAHVGDVEEFDWQVVEPFAEDVLTRYPSTYLHDGWAGNEDRIVARNALAEFGVSEYCGLVAYWVRPRPDLDRPDLADHWCAKIADGFEAQFGDLRKLGTASNGEAFFERRAA